MTRLWCGFLLWLSMILHAVARVYVVPGKWMKSAASRLAKEAVRRGSATGNYE